MFGGEVKRWDYFVNDGMNGVQGLFAIWVVLQGVGIAMVLLLVGSLLGGYIRRWDGLAFRA